jgi:predicted DNA-binding transcriptional regulator AlpA
VKHPQPVDPLLIPDTAAAALAGLSRAHWHRLRAAGKVPPSVRLGRKVLWRRLEIEAWIGAGCPEARTWAAMHAAADRRTPRVVG